MRAKSGDEARRQARANAERFERPYIVFVDTSGNWRVERYDTQKIEPSEIFYPESTMKSRDAFGRSISRIGK